MEPRYVRMIGAMKPGRKKEWSVYILRCVDGTFYTGIAKDLVARVAAHNAGKGAAYTRSHRPVELVHVEERFTRSTALIREAAIKRLSRHAKERLVGGQAAATVPRRQGAGKVLKQRESSSGRRNVAK